MKRFLAKCLLLALLVGGVLYLGGAAYRHTDTYRDMEVAEETQKYHHLPKELDFAVFGASHGRDLFPFFTEEDRAFNFAMSSQTPQYDWRIMRQFQDRIQPGAVVVLTVSYLCPYYYETEEDFLQKQERYYRFLSPQNIVDVDLAHWCLLRFSPLLTVDAADALKAFVQPAETGAVSNQEAGLHCLAPEDLDAERERIMQAHVGCIQRGFPEVEPTMWQAYHEMLEMCRDKGWNAVLVTPPYLAVYNDCFPEDFYPEYCRRMEELSETYGVPWLDYSHDSTFAEKFDWFKNIDHLNFAGAEAFADRFETDLAALGLT